MKKLTVGKYRNLSQCALPSGGFTILALDHRNNLRKSINPKEPNSVPNELLTSLKLEITTTIAKDASALLLDPEVGAFPVVRANALPNHVGLIVALEATGYTGNPHDRESKILDNWSVQKAKRLGANAVKLLVYYHPDSATAPSIERLVNQVNEECSSADLPFILEILTYPIDKKEKKLRGKESSKVIIESARILSQIGCDMLKLEFPIDINSNPDRLSWDAACSDLTSACQAPWVLLSASVDYPTYLDQVSSACKGGAVGIAAGRAVWKEAVMLGRNERQIFLQTEASERLQRLSELVSTLSPKFDEVYEVEKISYKLY